MERPIKYGLHWLAHLLLIAACITFMRGYPASLVRELALGTLVAIVAPALVLVGWQKHWRVSVDLTVAFSALALITLGLTITVGAVHALPAIVNLYTVYAIHLGPFYRLIHYALTATITAWTLVGQPRSARAEMGLMAILAYSALNGSFFRIEGERFALLYGLSLVTALMHLHRRSTLRPYGRWVRERNGGGWPPLSLPVFLFLLGGALATAVSLYAHNSLEQWLRLSNWALVYFLIVATVRERAQVERLLLAMLSMAVIVAVAGLGGVVGYASRAGWDNALRARLWVAGMHSNGVATFAVTYITLSAGLLLAWPSRWRRALLGGAIVLLLVCTFLTYSRSAEGGLFCGLAALFLLSGLGPTFSTVAPSSPPLARWKRWALGLSLLLPPVLIALATLRRTAQNVLISRLYIWRVVLNVIRQRPLLGVGLGNHFIPVFSDVLSYTELGAIEHLVGTHAHNLLLEIGEGMGLVGVGLFVWLLVAAARYGLAAIRQTDNAHQRGLLLALGAAGVALLAPHALVLSLSEATLLPADLWILLGLIVAVSRSEFRAERRERRRKRGKKPRAEGLDQPVDWREALLASLILIGVLLGVARPLAAAVAQQRGVAAWQQGDRAGARDALRQAIHLQPLDAALHAMLGDVTTGAEALEATRRASALRPTYAPYHSRLGWLYWAQNQFEQAVPKFEAAVALDRYGIDGGEHQSELGLAYAAAGRREQALAAFQEAVLLDSTSISRPDWQPTVAGAALAAAYSRYAETHQVDEELAQHIATHLGRPGPGPAAFESTGEPQITLQDVVDGLLAEAELARASDFERARRILSTLPELYLQWGMEEKVAQLPGASERSAEADAQAGPKAQAWRGMAFLEQGRLEEAQAEFQAALAVVGAQHAAPLPQLHHLLGTTYVEQGMLDEGIAELERAAESWDPSVKPKPFWALYWTDLARAYQQGGRLDEAIAAYGMAQFLELSIPSHLQLQLAIGEAYQRQADYAHEMDAYVRAVEILLAGERVGPWEQRMLASLAVHAAVSYQRQGLTAEEAVAAHESLIETGKPAGEVYLDLFRGEVERRLP